MEGSSHNASKESEAAALGLAYAQLCASHAALTDFRAKLLALLPIASGAGIFLLLEEQNLQALPAIGLFGFAVTLGLFIYELTGIRTCIDLRKRGKLLEERLGIPSDKGQFHYPALVGIGSVEGASWVVYLSVLLGWAYLAGENDGVWGSGRWLILLGVAGLVLILKFLPRPEPDDESHQITA